MSVVDHRPILYQWSDLSSTPFSTLALHPPYLTNGSSINGRPTDTIDLLYQWSVLYPFSTMAYILHTLTNGSSISMVNPQTH